MINYKFLSFEIFCAIISIAGIFSFIKLMDWPMIKVSYRENLKELFAEKTQSYASTSDRSSFDDNLIFFKDSFNSIIGIKMIIDVDFNTSFRHWTHNPDVKNIPKEIKLEIESFLTSRISSTCEND